MCEVRLLARCAGELRVLRRHRLRAVQQTQGVQHARLAQVQTQVCVGLSRTGAHR